MFRLLGKQRGKTVAVADIGSGSVGIAILATTSKGPANVVVAEHAMLPLEERTPEANLSGILGKLDEGAQKALTAYAERSGTHSTHVSRAYAVVRAPWTRSKTMRAEHAFDADTRIERSMISALAKQALEEDKDLDHTKIFEASVVRVELNGYPTARPEGKHAKHIAVSVLLSESDGSVRSGVTETLSRVFACPPPMMRSGTRALLTVLKENDVLKKYCFVVDIGAQATSLVTIRKDVATDIVHVPEGSSTILKRIAGEKMPEETLTMMRMLAHGQCERDACEAITQAIARAETDLVRIFGEAMAKMATSRRLPNDLILFAPQDMADWLVQFFSRIDFAQFTITTRPFSPRVESGKGLTGTLTFASGADANSDLSIASALVNIEGI
ncbi:hypothetical protein A3A40_01065 [Candidatus Kaiserbacteria bacterium RIFCSPLOWO2_01_FULL_54_20]|uniref:SHS2 domain-containing protein n=1 Tax=Candidatus Kaiserbacteria bacterium RIFCSPLOWO2_01_FULL_54_20 TaxID=1798513 RepID=A0A1F6EJ87_9BACT|nr:MAG: hypothetical protein A3A40_01065 [Candidatus Kaiserbacteria bacterium RIFCSPLOWO2_01_FULL_54_20]